MQSVNEQSELEKVFWSIFSACDEDERAHLADNLFYLLRAGQEDDDRGLVEAHPLMVRATECERIAVGARRKAEHKEHKATERSLALRAEVRTLNQKLERYKREGIKV